MNKNAKEDEGGSLPNKNDVQEENTSNKNEEEFYRYRPYVSTSLFSVVSFVVTIYVAYHVAVENNKKIHAYFNPPRIPTNVTNSTVIAEKLIVTNTSRVERDETVVDGKTNAIDRHEKENVLKRKEHITNAYDKKLLRRINEGELYKRQKYYPECISLFEKLYKEHPLSARAVYGQAQCLDYLSEEMRSNELLAKAIEAYGAISSLPDVPADLLKLALIRKSSRESFLGKKRDAVKTLIGLNKRLPDDIDVLSEVAVAYLNMRVDVQALPFLRKILRLDPSNGLAKCHLGFVLRRQERYEEAAKFIREGIASNHEGVHDARFYTALGASYTRSGKRKEAWKVYHQGAERGVYLSAEQRSTYNAQSPLRAIPFWNKEDTGYTKDINLLEYYWKQIREEALFLIKDDTFVQEKEGLTHQGDWREYYLYAQGKRNEANCRRALKTCRVLEQIETATGNKRGQIKFSVMQPGTHIWPHTGPTNTRLRVHVGLKIPKNVFLRVGGETRSWQQGKSLIIDDSIDHEVWHNGSESRLILIIDFWHPDLPMWERKSLPPI